MRNRVCAPGKEGHLCRRAKKNVSGQEDVQEDLKNI